MRRVRVETEQNVVTILVALAKCEKPINYDLKPAYEIIKYGKMNLKTQAVMFLEGSVNPESERLLVETFINAKNTHFKGIIAATLGGIGTILSLPVLKDELKIAKGVDYRYFIQSAIEEIEERIIN